MPKPRKSPLIGIRMCPDCGHKSVTYDVRDETRGLIRRRRCTECGVRWTTVEGPVDIWEALLEAEEKLTAAWVAIAAARNIITELTKGTPQTVRRPPFSLAGD